MAGFVHPVPGVQTLVLDMVKLGIVQLILVVTALAERCTRAVPVQKFPAKKVHVLRRVPATCSNWEKTWAWLTKADCGTKYRLDYVTVPPREVKQYKLQYVCCDGDTECKEAENIHSSGFDSTDEKFLAIVLGSTAACVIVVILIFAITFYSKKTRCLSICDQGSHVYASADGDESQDGTRESEKCQDCESETEQKACEAEYTEIEDYGLPRYTDLFQDNEGEKNDPFVNATAPPIYSEVSTKSYVNTSVRAPASLQSSGTAEEILLVNSQTFSEGTDDVFEETRPRHSSEQAGHTPDVKYYNVREKRKKKKRSSGSQGGSTSSSKGKADKELSASGPSARTKTKPGVPVSLEMMVKSSSASETIGKNSETSLIKQKRRSAPPDSVDVIGTIHNSAGSSHSQSSSSSTPGPYSNNTCSVIHEVSRRSSDKRSKGKNSKDNSLNKASSHRDYQNVAVISPKKTKPKDSAISSYPAIPSHTGSISPSNGVVLNCSDSTSVAPESLQSETPLPSEKDSLLRTPSCHSGCGSDQTFEDCEHCSRYDALKPSSEPDAVSLHVYQSLEDVRKDCQRLRDTSAVPSLPQKTDVYVNGNISRDCDIVNSDKKEQGAVAKC